MASAIFGAVRPLAEVMTQSICVWVVGWCCDAGGGEGGDQYCIDCSFEYRDIKNDVKRPTKVFEEP